MSSSPSPLSTRWQNATLPTIGGVVALATGVGPIGGLGLGIGIALLGLNQNPERTHRWAQRCLQTAVIGLGAGVNLPAVARAGANGLGITAATITTILIGGNLIGKWLGVPRHTRLLISAGTAICGGSAIAALAGALRPKHHETAVALGVVFVLNALALLIFPQIGHALNLSQTAFGWWAALAIHDTSSVVGAGLAYGPHALALATTIKLARALWIVPVVFAVSHWEQRFHAAPTTLTGNPQSHPPFPWFILGFIALAALTSFWPAARPASGMIALSSRRLMVTTLFLIGAGLSSTAFRTVGWRPLALGVAIWIPSGLIALLGVTHFS